VYVFSVVFLLLAMTYVILKPRKVTREKFGFTSDHGEDFELRYSSSTLSHSRHFSRRDIVQMSVYIQRIYHTHDVRRSAEHSRRRVL